MTMKPQRRWASFGAAGFWIAALTMAWGATPTETRATSSFGVQREAGRKAAEIDFDDIWFYEQDGTRHIPDIDLEWLTVAFNESGREQDAAPFAAQGAPDAVLKERAEGVLRDYDEIVGFLCDRNLAEDGCFLRLREDLSRSEVRSLIDALCVRDEIAYAHPTLILRGKTVGYFNAFRMTWKTSVDDASREALMKQAHVWAGHPGEIYRVDVLAVPFFKALNLLAEDLRVQHVKPVFVPLERSIGAELSVPLRGCQIGDRVPFLLRVQFSDRVRIDPSSLVNIRLRPTEIQKELFDLKFDPYDYVEAASKSPLLLTGWMKIYAPGEFVIPAVEIRYTCIPCSDDRVRSIETEEMRLRVGSILPSKGKAARLSVPTDDLTPVLPTAGLREKARRFRWQAWFLLALAAVLLAWSTRQWVVLRRERRAQTAEKEEDVLAERLRSFLARSPEGPHWVHAREGGRLLREYLDARYGLGRDPGLASGAVFLETVRGRLPQGVAGRLAPLFDEIDRMVAQETAEYADLGRWKKDILELVRQVQSNQL